MGVTVLQHRYSPNRPEPPPPFLHLHVVVAKRRPRDPVPRHATFARVGDSSMRCRARRLQSLRRFGQAVAASGVVPARTHSPPSPPQRRTPGAHRTVNVLLAFWCRSSPGIQPHRRKRRSLILKADGGAASLHSSDQFGYRGQEQPAATQLVRVQPCQLSVSDMKRRHISGWVTARVSTLVVTTVTSHPWPAIPENSTSHSVW